MKSNPVSSLWQMSWPLLMSDSEQKSVLPGVSSLKKKKKNFTSEKKNQWHAVIDMYSPLQKCQCDNEDT